MKTIKFWSIITVAVFLAAMMFTSCEDPLEEEVIASEVIDEGVSSKVTTHQISGTTESGATISGTELSYESWIKVKTTTAPKTRASGDDDVITVLLKDVFHNTDTTVLVNSLDIPEEYTHEISHRVNGNRRDGYVIITDSVMIYTVNFDDFSFDYKLEYEVAVYDDGITKETMPYHKIKNIRDNGYKLENMEFSVEPNFQDIPSVYLRKKLSHSITVEFNGSDYTLNAKVILKRYLGPHPCIVSSELLDSGISDIDDDARVTTYKSWIKLKHQYSDKTTSTQTHVVDLDGILKYTPSSYKVLESADVSFISAKKELLQQDDILWNENVQTTDFIYDLTFEYNLFTLNYKLHEEHAVYDNVVARFDFPILQYGEIKEEHTLKLTGTYTAEDGRLYDNYVFDGVSKIKFGNAWHFTYDDFQIIVYNE